MLLNISFALLLIIIMIIIIIIISIIMIMIIIRNLRVSFPSRTGLHWLLTKKLLLESFNGRARFTSSLLCHCHQTRADTRQNKIKKDLKYHFSNTIVYITRLKSCSVISPKNSWLKRFHKLKFHERYT